MVNRECLIPAVFRSGLDRRLCRQGVGCRRDLLELVERTRSKAFKSDGPSFLDVEVKCQAQMGEETGGHYLLVAPSATLRTCIERATGWVFMAIKPGMTATSAGVFRNALHQTCLINITILTTDNGKEFTDWLFCNHGLAPFGLGIEYHLPPPRSPQINGMVQRFNGGICGILMTHQFDSALGLEQT